MAGDNHCDFRIVRSIIPRRIAVLFRTESRSLGGFTNTIFCGMIDSGCTGLVYSLFLT